jgi:hypothetical protein
MTFWLSDLLDSLIQRLTTIHNSLLRISVLSHGHQSYGNGFQRWTFSFLPVLELWPRLSHSNSWLTLRLAATSWKPSLLLLLTQLQWRTCIHTQWQLIAAGDLPHLYYLVYNLSARTVLKTQLPIIAASCCRGNMLVSEAVAINGCHLFAWKPREALNPWVTEERYWALFCMPLHTFLHNLLNVLVHSAEDFQDISSLQAFKSKVVGISGTSHSGCKPN